MADWLHAYAGESCFKTEAEAYEYLGRQMALLFGGYPRQSVLTVLMRYAPTVTKNSPFDGDAPEFEPKFRLSVRHGRLESD